MDALKIATQETIIDLNDNEQVEVTVTTEGPFIVDFSINAFWVYSEALETHLKQDLFYVQKNYPATFEEICSKVENQLLKAGF